MSAAWHCIRPVIVPPVHLRIFSLLENKLIGYADDSTLIVVPVAEVLAYLHVQSSPISCNVVGSILHVLGKNTNTAIVGYRWTGVGGHHALYC